MALAYTRLGDINLSTDMANSRELSATINELSSKICDIKSNPLSGHAFSSSQTIEYILSSIIVNLGGTYTNES